VIAVIVQVALVDGKPRLELPDDVQVVRDGRYFHISWGDQVMTLLHIGTPASGPILIGQMTKGVAAKLAHLGARVIRLRDAWSNLLLRTWLKVQGVTEDNGRLRTPHVIAGGSQIDEDEENDI